MVCGIIKTNTMANNSEAYLPTDSVYATVKKKIVARNRGEDVASASMPSHKFAEKLFGDVMGGVDSLIYRGYLASTIRLLSSWLPTFTQICL